MNDSDSDYEFYVGTATHLEGASLAIDGTARIDDKIVGKVAVKHLIVGPGGVVQGDISGETAKMRHCGRQLNSHGQAYRMLIWPHSRQNPIWIFGDHGGR